MAAGRMAPLASVSDEVPILATIRRPVAPSASHVIGLVVELEPADVHPIAGPGPGPGQGPVDPEAAQRPWA